MRPVIHPAPDTRGKQAAHCEEDLLRAYFEKCIKLQEEDEVEEDERKMPWPQIIVYPGLLDKLWGWDRLLASGIGVSGHEYRCYLEAYSRNTKTAAKDLHIADIAKTCCKKEEELVRKFREIDNMERTLPLKKSTILCCIIRQCANPIIHTKNCTSSAVSNAALWCMTTEADLTLELLRCGANPSNDELVTRSSSIRICVLSLMNCTLDSSTAAAASGIMWGIAKDAKRMCEWMRENNQLIDFCADLELSRALTDGNMLRWRSLDHLYNMLQESAAAAAGGGCGGGCKTDGAAKTYGGSISDILYSRCKNIRGRKRPKKQKNNGEEIKTLKNNDDNLVNIWGRGRLLPYKSSVEWSSYINYLADYYMQNAVGFLAHLNIDEWLLDPPARAVQIDTSRLAAAVAMHCVKMEEELVSKWKSRVPRERSTTFSISTIIESSLITERALAICSTKGEISISSAIAFVCIAMEADLMCEMLKRDADPTDKIIEQSRVIRMCALGLSNLKGNQSNVFAAAMVGMAKEAKRLSDWMRDVNELFTLDKFSTYAVSELVELFEACGIRTSTLDVMTRILREFSFPRACDGLSAGGTRKPGAAKIGK